MDNHRNEGIQHLTPEAALTALASHPQGLPETEALRRLAEYGPNRVAAIRAAPWLSLFLRHFTHFFALILWLAAVLAFVAERFQPGEGMAVLGGAILGVIALNGLFSFAQEYRAEHALAALREMLPRQVQVLRSGATREIPVESLVPGDVLMLAGGNDVPADCRLIEAFGVRVNTATVTGESIPKSRIAAAVGENDLLQAGNLLLAGTALVAGEAKAVVYATGAHTEFGRIAGLTQSTAKVSSPLQQEITRLSRWIAVIATGVGVVFFVAGLGSGISVWSSLLFAIGIIVANVPEGLLPTVTLALAMGAQRMARRNALIRHLPSVETLGATTVICTDKTGTLTENRLRVVRCHADGVMQESEATNPAVDALREIAAHCHALHPEEDAAPGDWLGDPLEIALAAWAAAGGQRPGSLPRIDELPFDSDRRRMSTVHPHGDGRILFCKGAAESVLPLCDQLLSGGIAEPLDAAGRRDLQAAEEALALHGYRVIALARRELPQEDAETEPERGLCFVGLLALEDPVRPEVPAAVEACHNAGIRVLMVTGDHPRTALAVARRIGLVGASARVIAGSRLARMTAAELQLALEHRELVFARISADQKRRIVEALKRKGETVAATGDGVNDAPALREAHIGIAMGRAGTDVAKAAADMVLLDDNFASIVAAIEEGRAVFDNIRKFLAYILTSNVPEAVPYVAFVLLGIPLPLTVIQVLAVDLGTDMLPALALGAEPPHPGVMQRPPRPRHQRLVDRALALRAYAWLGVLEATAAMCAYFSVLHAGGWTFGQPLAGHDPLYREATTACFGAIVLMQVANVWVCRSEREPLLGAWRPPRNRLLLLGVGLELLALAAIVWTPWGNAVVGTAPLDPAVWWVVLPFAGVMLVGEELRKRRASAVRRPFARSRPER